MWHWNDTLMLQPSPMLAGASLQNLLTFSRSSAPPRPFTTCRLGSTSSAPSMARSNSDTSSRVARGIPRPASSDHKDKNNQIDICQSCALVLLGFQQVVYFLGPRSHLSRHRHTGEEMRTEGLLVSANRCGDGNNVLQRAILKQLPNLVYGESCCGASS